MTYDLKILPELAWALASGALVALITALATLEPSEIVDWKLWAIGIGVQSLRAGAGAVLVALGKGTVAR